MKKLATAAAVAALLGVSASAAAWWGGGPWGGGPGYGSGANDWWNDMFGDGYGDFNSDFRATDMTPSPEQGIQAAWCGILVSIRRIARHTSPLLPQTLYNMADNMAEAGS